jgi:hypothetical protein
MDLSRLFQRAARLHPAAFDTISWTIVLVGSRTALRAWGFNLGIA